MYALKARDKYYKREKEREEEYREERRSRAREQHTHHHRFVTWGHRSGISCDYVSNYTIQLLKQKVRVFANSSWQVGKKSREEV